MLLYVIHDNQSKTYIFKNEISNRFTALKELIIAFLLTYFTGGILPQMTFGSCIFVTTYSYSFNVI